MLHIGKPSIMKCITSDVELYYQYLRCLSPAPNKKNDMLHISEAKEDNVGSR